MVFQKDHKQSNTGRTHFKKGHTSWLKGTKGLAKPNSGSFKQGHNAGINHENYNGGFSYDKNKNMLIVRCRDNSYTAFSRIVYENYIRRSLTSNELIHHLDRDTNNNDISNLILVTRAEHVRIHKPRLGTGDRVKIN